MKIPINECIASVEDATCKINARINDINECLLDMGICVNECVEMSDNYKKILLSKIQWCQELLMS